MSMTCHYAGAFAFTDPNGRPAYCWLAVYSGPGRLPLAVVVEDPANPGASVTNSSEELATAIWHELLPRAADGFMLVELYLDPTRKNPDLRERWAVVELRLEHGRLLLPRWRPTTRAAIEALIGSPISVPFRSSYTLAEETP